jgi:hypothetical protein
MECQSVLDSRYGSPEAEKNDDNSDFEYHLNILLVTNGFLIMLKRLKRLANSRARI